MRESDKRNAAKSFADYWKDKGYEKGESQPYWLSLLRDVFGVESPEKFITFEEQVKIANDYHLPVIVHDREAHGDTLAILKKYRPQGVLHCFSGSTETAKEILDLGMYIGLGGAVTFKNAKKPVEVAKYVPEDRLLLETDCPYMTPVPFRGQRNDSTFIQYTADFIAQLRGTDTQTLIDKATQNALTLFALR